MFITSSPCQIYRGNSNDSLLFAIEPSPKYIILSGHIVLLNSTKSTTTKGAYFSMTYYHTSFQDH